MEAGSESEAFLEQLRREGALDSEGAFTENTEAMFQRLSSRLFQDPEEYLLCFFQAFLVGGAAEIVYEATGSWVELRSEKGRLEALPSQWPPLAIDRGAGSGRYLAAGLVGAWSHYSEIHVDSGRECRVYRPASGPRPEVRTSRQRGIRIVLYRLHHVLIPRRPSQPRLLAYPVPILLPALVQLTDSKLQDNSYSPQGEPLVLPDAEPHPDNITCRIEGVCLESGGPLAVPIPLGGGPVFWDREPEGEPLFRSQTGVRREWRSASRFLLLRRPMKGVSYLIAIEAGVALRPLEVELGYPGLVLVVSLESEGLCSDLSGSQLRRDQALEGFLERTRATLPAWLDGFSEKVKRWTPPLGHDLNAMPAVGAGIAGFVGGVVLFGATGFFFPPFLALGGAFVGDRAYARWKKQSIEHDLRQVIDEAGRVARPGDGQSPPGLT